VHGDAPQQELELGVEPDAVPRARRFAASVLNGLASGLVGDAELIVTELVTNALLYAGPPVTLRVLPGQNLVRLEVVDHSRALPLRLVESTEAMTGRGLALVESLSQRTGVEPLTNGKVVWCELTGEPPVEADLAEIDIDALLASWPDDPLEQERRYTVLLGEVPTDLLLAAKAHVDNVVREFALASGGAASGTTTALPPHLAELIDTVVHGFAEVRQAVKRQASAAARHGQERTELSFTLPVTSASAGEDYLAALDEVDAYARAARMLTLESPPQHRIFRRWYVETLITQLRATAHGDVRQPQTFESRLLQEVGVLATAHVLADRATRLQTVTAALAQVGSPGEVAGIALAEGVAALDAVGGSLLVPSEDQGFRV
jgi:anti-sigma regulatory factor (Ser/Thr protein kinase)